jgi:hypothetical protein
MSKSPISTKAFYNDLFGRTEELLVFFNNLRDHIHELDEVTLTMLISTDTSLTNKRKNSADIKALINAPINSSEREEILNKIITEIENGTNSGDDDDEDVCDTVLNKNTASVSEITSTVNKDKEVELERIITSMDDLAYLDTFKFESDDLETVNFFINKELNAIWQMVLTGKGADILKDLSSVKRLGKNREMLKNRFMAEYSMVSNIPVPQGYDFRINNELVKPSLMQNLICHRLATKKRYGNWSGTGAGKTLSAILASRYIDAKVSIIIAYNSTLKGWESAIMKTFPDSNVIMNDKVLGFDTSKHNYLIFNYEKFQQDLYGNYILELTETGLIDLIVLDEIQSVKQRDEKAESKRRVLIKSLVNLAANNNPELKVLGMSATPVINNLLEAKNLLSLINGVELIYLQHLMFQTVLTSINT